MLSSTRESLHLHQQALEEYEAARRSAQRQTREAFLGVKSGISRVEALSQRCVPRLRPRKRIEAGIPGRHANLGGRAQCGARPVRRPARPRGGPLRLHSQRDSPQALRGYTLGRRPRDDQRLARVDPRRKGAMAPRPSANEHAATAQDARSDPTSVRRWPYRCGSTSTRFAHTPKPRASRRREYTVCPPC